MEALFWVIGLFIVGGATALGRHLGRKAVGLDKAATVDGVAITPLATLLVKAKGVEMKARGLTMSRNSGRLMVTAAQRLVLTNTRGECVAIDVPVADVAEIGFEQGMSTAFFGGKLTVKYTVNGADRVVEFRPAGGNTQYRTDAEEYEAFKEWLDALQAQRAHVALPPVATSIKSRHHQ
jgi:hypothetical protein